MTLRCGVQGRADESQIIKAVSTFGLGRLREEVDGVGWMLRGLGWLT